MDDELAYVVDTAPRSPLHEALWRMHGVDYEALSGVGASRHGGRFNEKGTNTVYMARPRGTAVIEVIAGLTLAKVPVRPAKYVVQTIEAKLDECIDLRDRAVVEHLGLSAEILASAVAPPILARVGSVAAYLGVEAVVFPSSRADGGTNVAAFVDNCVTSLAPTGQPAPLEQILDEDAIRV